MKLIIHDLKDEEFERLFPHISQDTRIVSKEEKGIKKCVGCFGCWLKTPGACIIRDGFETVSASMARCTDIIIITKVVYGGYSPFVKNVLDRNISFILPYFEIRNHEMHHVPRYPNKFKLTVYGYGEDLSDSEKKVFKRLVEANALNLNARENCGVIVPAVEAIAECLEVQL